MYAPDRSTAEAEIKTFRETYEAKYPKAVASLTDHQAEMLSFMEAIVATSAWSMP